ncbi:MAG: hypothetical protein A2297_00250 [Elusimicrobia bacterium RIFOXYB2_FULL_48_7]|nr:MAG: hypothetical protein A2297_00250 [Elusimicrobia bacterium RIFOXYB2_FULL_48_7]
MKRLILIALVVAGCFYAAKTLSNKSFILYYHNVAEHKGGLRSLYVSSWTFEMQMKYLHWRKYKTIPLEELVSRIKNRRPIPRKTFAVTFDDGYRNNYSAAYPIMKKYGYTATVFLAVNEIGRTLAHYRTVEEKRLNTRQIREMSSYFTFGSHTMTHGNLALMKKFQAKNELSRSRKEIMKITGREVKLFCYPIGRFNPEVKALVKETGYDGACSTYAGLVDGKTDPYELPRIEWKGLTASSVDNFWKLKWFYLKIILGI